MFYASKKDINAAIPLDVIYITSGIIYKIEMGQCQMKNIILWRKVSTNINNQRRPLIDVSPILDTTRIMQ